MAATGEHERIRADTSSRDSQTCFFFKLKKKIIQIITAKKKKILREISHLFLGVILWSLDCLDSFSEVTSCRD